jgi:hypothetical protein
LYVPDAETTVVQQTPPDEGSLTFLHVWRTIRKDSAGLNRSAGCHAEMASDKCRPRSTT